jgi:hypothetical protein
LAILRLVRWWSNLSRKTSLNFRMDNRSFAINPPKIEFGKDYRKKYDLSSVGSLEKSGHNQRNGWSQCSGMGGHNAAE